MKNSKVIFISRPTELSLPPDRVLEAAVGSLSEVVVVGIDKGTGDLYFATSVGKEHGGRPEVNMLLDRAKSQLLESYIAEEEQHEQ